MSIQNLEPQALWAHFAALNAVPRPSKKEAKVIAFMQQFGQSLGLETLCDEVGNVIIKKPATAGMENRPKIVLQSHLDMVHQKNNDTDFNFDEQGIEMYVEGDWVKAKGTTLGADNGIGVAAIMALLSSQDIEHPALEALFTIDEETGMTGALELKGGLLSGQYLLNLDTEDDCELTIGCAGGIDVTAQGTYTPIASPIDLKAYRITIKGLTGGHSGMDIHLGRANANKLMNRLLYKAAEIYGLRIGHIAGGSLRNAIPRESVATVVIPSAKTEAFEQWLCKFAGMLQSEYQSSDPELRLLCEACELPQDLLPQDFQQQLLAAIYAAPNGIYRMSPDIKDLVQTSNNIAKVEVGEGQYQILCLTRSSVDSEKMDEADALRAVFELIGATVSFGGAYPGWTPLPNSGLVQTMSRIYEQRFGHSPHVNACHAGLECGILGTHYPHIEMISFGPNIRGAHSPDEMVQISSVQKFWGFLLQALSELK